MLKNAPAETPKIKRLFIEVAPANEYNAWELQDSLEACQDLSGSTEKEFWWKVVSEARFEPNLFHFILEADEIYMSTAIIPLVAFTSVGSPDLWNKMMALAVDKGVKCKRIYTARVYEDIEWQNLNKALFRKAFRNNYLFVASDEYDRWSQVDCKKVFKPKAS